MKKILLILLVTSQSLLGFGQGATATIPNLTASPGTVAVPINVTNFNNIAAITMFFEYDPAVVSYSTYNNPALSGLEVNAFTVGASHRIGISWSASGSTGSNVSGTLVNIVFNYVSGSGDFTFQPSISEITDNEYNTVPVFYTNGSIGPQNPALISIPQLLNQTPANGFLIPLNVDFQGIPGGVNSFSFIVEYDATKLVYQNFQNAALSGITITPLTSPTRLAVEWEDAVNAGSLLNGKLLDIVFNYIGGTSALAFDEANCHIADNNVIEVPAVYSDGLVTQDPASVVTVMASTIAAQPGTEVLIPVTVDNFTNIGAFDLFINYTQSVLGFVGLVNINPLIGLNLASNPTTNGVGINWYATSGALTIPAGGKLFDMKFNYSSGSTPLTFDQLTSAISTTNYEELNVNYVNGAISEITSNNATAVIPDILAVPLTSVELPVNVTGFTDLGAFDLVIGYDIAALNFTDIVNIQSDLSALGTFSYNASGGKVYISWEIDPAATVGIDIVDNDKLFDLNFFYNAGNSDLVFDLTLCAVSKNDYSPVNVAYTDGSVNSGIGLQLKLYLEGLYNSAVGGMNKAKDFVGGVLEDRFVGTTADLITIELHDAANYSNLIYQVPDIGLNQDGTATIILPVEYSGNYFITIRNRNHMTTVSQARSFASTSVSYDFTTAASQAFGTNQKQLASGIFGIFAGDVNQDAVIDAGDMISLDNDASIFTRGYVITDINGDGTVDQADMNILYSNAEDFVSLIKP